jgi:septal ring factor EnvC (AmiA/AmiB activator)
MCLADDTSRLTDSARQDYEKITEEIEIKKRKQSRLRKRERSLLERLDRLAFDLDRKKKELKSLELEQARTEKAIRQKQKEVQQIRDQMMVTQERIEDRLARLYKMSRVGPWVFLLSGENYTDFLRMSRFFFAMVDDDVDLLGTFETQLDREEALQKELETYHREVREKQARLRQKKREFVALTRQEKNALEEVKLEKAAYAKLLDDLEKQAERLQSMIQSLPNYGQHASRKGAGFMALKGTLPVPVEGKLAANQDTRLRGISLTASPDAVVRGVCKGRVVFADWFKGYGNLMIVDHGDNFHTVMAHLSEMLKKRGDWIAAGDAIAKVGRTGSLSGPALYFEIRHRGVPLNPFEWFSQKDQLALR